MERLKQIVASALAFLLATFGSRAPVISMDQDPIIQDVFAASTEAFLSDKRSAIDSKYARTLKELRLRAL